MIAAISQSEQDNFSGSAEESTPPQATPARRKRFLYIPLPRIKRPKVKRPHLGLRRFAKNKLNAQLKGDKPTPGRVTEEFFRLIGFDSVVEAWKHPTHRTTKLLASLGSKAADMMAGRLVNTSIKLIAITMLTGFFGGSVLLTMGLTALATGVGSALYTYHRNYLHDRFRGPKEERKNAKYITRARLKQAGITFLTSGASGAFGAWLGKTDFMQSIVKSVKGFVHHIWGAVQSGVSTGASAVESVVVPQSQPAPAVALPPNGSLQKSFTPVATRLTPIAPAPVAVPKPARGLAP